MKFERRRPPPESNPASLAMAKHAQSIYEEMGRKLGADDKVAGGGTDAAFAGLSGKAAVVERFGLQGFGAHSADGVRAHRFHRAAAVPRDAHGEDIAQGKVAAR